ncbi:hypothetical protein [Lichenifustis flavocetrariae]|uniref:Uncharacterized protein n=1 Tax=Lichenifustis flavocetrariae TaxID=2949735 RepID=A0AA41Z3F4_9HYPH|nr:hypothetical protein [Lichenifustis flavocetrariae]MCW6512296.1 hypothetical protein [Lichenifustis flavocetrariae]
MRLGAGASLHYISHYMLSNHIPSILDSIIATFIVFISVSIYSGIRFVFTPPKHIWIFGKWYHHSIEYKDNTYVLNIRKVYISCGIRRVMYFKRWFVRQPTDDLSYDESSDYDCSIEIENGLMYMKSRSTKTNEQVFEIFQTTAPPENKIMIGLNFSRDQRNRASTRATVLSRDIKTFEAITALLNEQIGIDAKFFAIAVSV